MCRLTIHADVVARKTAPVTDCPAETLASIPGKLVVDERPGRLPGKSSLLSCHADDTKMLERIVDMARPIEIADANVVVNKYKVCGILFGFHDGDVVDLGQSPFILEEDSCLQEQQKAVIRKRSPE